MLTSKFYEHPRKYTLYRKVIFEGVYIIFLIIVQSVEGGFSSELSNEVPKRMFET